MKKSDLNQIESMNAIFTDSADSGGFRRFNRAGHGRF
jgi:hypothetical protein